MTGFKGAIFDLDGTLLDSMRVWSEIDVKFLGKRGFSVPRDYVKIITPMGFRQTAEYTIKRFSLGDTPEELMAEWAEMTERAYRFEIPAKKGAIAYVRRLKDRGLKLAVASASEKKAYFPALKRLGIFDLFDAFTSLCEVGRDKSFPDIYHKTAEKLGLAAEECVVFEDTLTTVKSAKSGGFYTVAVFDEASADHWNELNQVADVCIKNFEKEAILWQEP